MLWKEKVKDLLSWVHAHLNAHWWNVYCATIMSLCCLMCFCLCWPPFQVGEACVVHTQSINAMPTEAFLKFKIYKNIHNLLNDQKILNTFTCAYHPCIRATCTMNLAADVSQNWTNCKDFWASILMLLEIAKCKKTPISKMSFVNIIKWRATCVSKKKYGNDDINGCS